MLEEKERMIGTSISDMVLAFQQEAARVMKESKGDMWTVIRHALSELQKRGILNVADKKNLELSFGEALDVARQ